MLKKNLKFERGRRLARRVGGGKVVRKWSYCSHGNERGLCPVCVREVIKQMSSNEER